MVREKRDLYSILSLLTETIDTMRTELIHFHSSSDDVYRHLAVLLAELHQLDDRIDAEQPKPNR